MSYGLEKYKCGQVWERDGKRREITAVVDGYVSWRKNPRTPAQRMCWCSTWIKWASKARLVEDAE